MNIVSWILFLYAFLVEVLFLPILSYYHIRPQPHHHHHLIIIMNRSGIIQAWMQVTHGRSLLLLLYIMYLFSLELKDHKNASDVASGEVRGACGSRVTTVEE